MKRFTKFSTLAVILPLVPISWAGASAQPLLSSTQFDKKSAIRSRNLKIIASIKTGEAKKALNLEILKNVSHKKISFRDTDVLIDYSFVVKDRESNVLPRSEQGRRRILESGMISHKPPMILRPGEQVMKQLVITDIYDFRPGEVYTITVYRRISLDKGKTFEEARSNMITAKINKY